MTSSTFKPLGAAPHEGRYLSGKCILMISAEPWNGLQMSKHHLAEELAKRGNRILWLDTPKNGSGPTTFQLDGAVERVVYHHWLRGVNDLPAFMQKLYSGTLFHSIEECAGERISIIWQFDPSRLRHLSQAGRRSIFHPVDLNVLESGRAALRKADIVLTVSKDIMERAQEMEPEVAVMNIGHALDPRWLEPREECSSSVGNVRPVVAYAGNLGIQYMDWEVLHAEVTGNPEVDFRFFGPMDPIPKNPWFLKLREQLNVRFMGQVPKEKLIHELRDANVLLLCYRSDLWPKQLSNSHKLIEYFSTGNVIIASATSEYQGTSPLVMPMANERWEHPALLSKVLNDLVTFNTPELRAARMLIARSRTTAMQVDAIERMLQAL